MYSSSIYQYLYLIFVEMLNVHTCTEKKGLEYVITFFVLYAIKYIFLNALLMEAGHVWSNHVQILYLLNFYSIFY